MTQRRCPARFVEANGRWYQCFLNDDDHVTHYALLHGKSFDAEITWSAAVKRHL